MSERMFSIIVPNAEKKSTVYQPMTAKKSIETMERLVKRGHNPIAKTEANGITEYLTHAQMSEIYADFH